ncbi:MAG: transposase [Acetobacteraceae bacterium]|nr:transposase [Acetobacteraceae bacterium]
MGLFHQPLRQTEGLLRSIAALLHIDIRIPDHTTYVDGPGLAMVLFLHRH